MARPTKYKPEFVEQAEKLCRLGATDVEVADFFKVSTVTLYRWQIQNDELCKALKVGKELADDRVEMSLFHRACGYSHPDVDIRVVGGKIVKTEIVRHYPPDTTACIFWLKNRRPEEWRDKTEHTLEAGKSIVDIYARMLDSGSETQDLPDIKHVESEDITPAALIESKEGL